jgi:hypothetical protein
MTPGRDRIIFCRQCDAYIPQYNRPTGQRVCAPCRTVRYRGNGRDKANNAVQKAIRDGLLLKPQTQACRDCGVVATEYDHRDYSKPLEVDPVCGWCNKRRGPGKWVKYEPLRGPAA